MTSGRVRTRSGDRYKPSAIRSYEAALRDHIAPRLGRTRLADVQHRDVQRIADDLLAERRDPSTIRNALMPLRVIFRRAVEDGDLAISPCTHLRLPAVRSRRERIASPEEAERLIAALPERDRPIWATALYAGLRRGEVMALRWADVDLANGVIRIERAYDEKAHVEVEPKSRPAGGRSRSSERFATSSSPTRGAKIEQTDSYSAATRHSGRQTSGAERSERGDESDSSRSASTPGSEAEAAALVDAYLVRAGQPITHVVS